MVVSVLLWRFTTESLSSALSNSSCTKSSMMQTDDIYSHYCRMGSDTYYWNSSCYTEKYIIYLDEPDWFELPVSDTPTRTWLVWTCPASTTASRALHPRNLCITCLVFWQKMSSAMTASYAEVELVNQQRSWRLGACLVSRTCTVPLFRLTSIFHSWTLTASYPSWNSTLYIYWTTSTQYTIPYLKG